MGPIQPRKAPELKIFSGGSSAMAASRNEAKLHFSNGCY